jgi:N-acetylglucosamine transport system permease protein
MTSNSNMNFSKKVFIAIFILPAIIGFSMFSLYPMLRGMYISLYQWSGVTSTMKFIGIENFKQLIGDPYIIRAFKNEFFIVFWKVIIITTVSLFFAIAITRSRLMKNEKSFYRIIFFFPNILSVIIITNIWSFVYHPTIGLLNSGLEAIGLGKFWHAWLGEPNTVMWALVPVVSWAGIGLFMIIFIAAIKCIPDELFESALIDGAGEWRQLISITIPLIREQIKFSIVTIIITTFGTTSVFVIAMTQGQPDNASQVVGSYIYDLTFKQYRAGYATALGMVLFIVVLTVTGITNKLMNKEIDI